MTALHWACKRNQYEITFHLINHGADIDYQDIIGRTPLYFAIMSENTKIVELLLDN